MLKAAGYIVAALALGLLCRGAIAAEVLVDQVGYETQAPKHALVQGTDQDRFTHFRIVDARSGKVVLKGELDDAGHVDDWHDWHYWAADFSTLDSAGTYVLETGARHAIRSHPFKVQDDVLERHTLSDVIYYFKTQRVSGAMNRADSHLPLPGDRQGTVDIHGGWYDATGDYGVHLSHQNPTSYFNPQQMPLVVWSMVNTWRNLKARHSINFTQYQRRLITGARFGADFLVRDKRGHGSFYESIFAPGKDKLAKDRLIGAPNWHTRIKTNPDSTGRRITKQVTTEHGYEASFRAGGGVAIAALAAVSTLPGHGEFPRERYLEVAENAYHFLEENNLKLTNDGKKNILDDYSALLAATELYRATEDPDWLGTANRRADSLMARLTTHDGYRDYWRADDDTRPFFHPSDAGLPVVALVQYADIVKPARRARVRDVVRRSLEFELRTTAEVNNPFGYARQLVRMGDGTVRTAFFFPHDTRAAPWWQGEDARLASLAAAARVAAPMFSDDPAFQGKLEQYAWNQLHWILGRNPYDICMLTGSGDRNAEYMYFTSWEYTTAPGGILNGITAGIGDEDGIAFGLGYARTGRDDDWRWTEQWLPHAAWYMYAISLPHHSG